MIDLLPNAEELEIADSIANFLKDGLPVGRFRARYDGAQDTDADLWPRLADIGCFGIGLPESVAGIGLSIAEETLAFREFGRYLVSPNVLASVLAAHCAAGKHAQALAESLVGGQRQAVLAIPILGTNGPTLTGEFQLFDASDQGVVVAWSDDGMGLYDLAGFSGRTRTAGLDETVALDIAQASGLLPLHWISATDLPLPDRARVLCAAMLVGICEAVRNMAVEYAKTRIQFGKPIGSFQAIKHKCADMALNAEAAWSETIYAALALRAGHADAAFHAANAKMLAAGAALSAAKENIQIHGGMGYTAEVDAHLYMKRAHVLHEIGGNIRRMQQLLLSLPIGD